jgi:hypothetical protein
VPFDPTNWRQPKVTVLPPTITGRGGKITPPSPERGGGGPQRIHVQIEIVDRRGPPARHGFPVIRLLLILFLLAMMFGCEAKAQPGQWPPDHPTYEHLQGRNWRGEIFRQGTVEDTRIYGPDGRQRHCHSYVPGGAQGNAYRITTCD